MFPECSTDAASDTEAPPPGAADDWTVLQRWERFSAEDHAVWDTLFARQQAKLSGRLVREFAQGLDLLRLSHPGIPRLEELNERLLRRTGWTVVSVPGLVPDNVFFRHLSQRRFPAGNFIRPANQLDYLEEPDVFHDIFGHVPMLADPRMADFIQALGELAPRAGASGALHRVARLYWYSVEFGLARQDGELRIYGAGLASSFSEAEHALRSPAPRRLPFDLRAVLRTSYRSDRLQSCYFVVDDFDELLASGLRFDSLLAALDDAADLDPDTGNLA